MKYHVRHTTTYEYGDTVPLCQNEAHLRPRRSARQRSITHDLKIAPRPSTMAERTDYFGNHVTFFTVDEGHQKLSITAESVVTLQPTPTPNAAETPAWEYVAGRISNRTDPEVLEAVQFTFPSPSIPVTDHLHDYAVPSFPPNRPLLEAVGDLNHRIHTEFQFDPQATGVTTLPTDVLRQRRGVCQDFAHLMVGCLRSLGLAARYVSGYLLTEPPPGKPKLQGADVSHAWVAVFVPDYGWVDFDPTNDCIPTTHHVTLAWGRDYGDVCPIKGVFIGGGSHAMKVSVDVVPME